jgi:hypothetical protein
MSSNLHVYTWLDLPPLNDAERDAKEWLEKFVQNPDLNTHQEKEEFLARYKVVCRWKGRLVHCTGASSMGDVWLRDKGSTNFYDHRVTVTELSNWKRVKLPHTPKHKHKNK